MFILILTMLVCKLVWQNSFPFFFLLFDGGTSCFVKRKQAVQGMDVFLKVVTALPGIDNHDANAVTWLATKLFLNKSGIIPLLLDFMHFNVQLLLLLCITLFLHFPLLKKKKRVNNLHLSIKWFNSYLIGCTANVIN